jgi:muramoyltetrapeptide carboxypeptidase
MDRRSFNKNVLKAGIASTISPLYYSKKKKRKKIIKARALKKGDTVALLTPASAVREGQIEKAIKNVEALGFNYKTGKYIEARNGYLAGTDQQRADDLNNMLADPEVKAIWCIRGGYGLTRILHKIDFKLLRKRPIPIIGYSDITALHHGCTTIAGVSSIHGAVAGSTIPDSIMALLKKQLLGGSANTALDPSFLEEATSQDDSAFDPFILNKGIVKGKLTGGNLSLLASLAGTPYLDSFKNKIVFIEDIGEKPYRIDRMLTQLIHASDLRDAAAICLGVHIDCEADSDELSLTLKEVFEDRIGSLNIPASYGFPVGHFKYQYSWPMNIEASVNLENRTVIMLEDALEID